MRNVHLKNITDKADSLAREYNRTKDPSIRDQWFKLIKSITPKIEAYKKNSSTYVFH